MTLVLKSNRAVTDTSLPFLKRDALLKDDNGGVLSLIDFSNRYCYDGLPPISGKAVRNINDSENDSHLIIGSGESLLFEGNGIDFSELTNRNNNNIILPAAIAADLSTQQYFLACLYLKLPSSEDWNNAGTIAPIWTFSLASYQTQPEFFVMGFAASSKSITLRRQTDINVASMNTIVPALGDHGGFAQLALWRNDTEMGARLKTVNGVKRVGTGSGDNNAQDISSLAGVVGVPNNSWSASASAGAYKMRIYRLWIENLATSGRNPEAVLDADYARIVTRGVFS